MNKILEKFYEGLQSINDPILKWLWAWEGGAFRIY
jgi:hypothetical protein